MKKLIIYTLLLFVSFSYGQKKELRNANKFYTSGEYSSALDLLDSSKSLFDSSDDKIKSQVMLLYGKIHTSMEDFSLAIKAFDMSRNMGISNQILSPELSKLETAIITSAVGDNETENFSEAGEEEILNYHGKLLKQVKRLNKFFNKFDRTKAAKIMAKGEQYKDLEEKYRLEHFKRVSGEIPESVATHQLHVELMDVLKQINTFIELIASTLLDLD